MINKLEYELIQYLINEEPLHILIGGFTKEGKCSHLFKALIHLIELGYINCYADGEALKLNQDMLNKYLELRLRNKEQLDEYPAVCPEYDFVATDKGIRQLRVEDRPS